MEREGQCFRDEEQGGENARDAPPSAARSVDFESWPRPIDSWLRALWKPPR